MSRRTDLEKSIRASYALIRQYEDIVRLTDDPKKEERSQKDIDKQWKLIRGALDECERLGGPLSPDLAEIAAHFAAPAEVTPAIAAPAASKYQIHIDQATGLAIGDGPQVGDVEAGEGIATRVLPIPQGNPYIWVEVSLNYQLQPSDLATAYRTNPSVDAYNKLLNSTSSMRVDARLFNSGTATARDVYVVVQTSHALYFSSSTDWDITTNRQRQAAFQARRPLHPDGIAELFSIAFQEIFHNKSGQPDSWEIIPHFDKVSLKFLIYAEDYQHREIVVEFVPEDLSFETGKATKKGKPEG